MRLLFDHNMSPRLIRLLADLFPDSDHLFFLKLHESEDPVVWDYAKANGFVITSKDSDFSNRSVLFGPSAKGDSFAFGQLHNFCG